MPVPTVGEEEALQPTDVDHVLMDSLIEEELVASPKEEVKSKD